MPYYVLRLIIFIKLSTFISNTFVSVEVSFFFNEVIFFYGIPFIRLPNCVCCLSILFKNYVQICNNCLLMLFRDYAKYELPFVILIFHTIDYFNVISVESSVNHSPFLFIYIKVELV